MRHDDILTAFNVLIRKVCGYTSRRGWFDRGRGNSEVSRLLYAWRTGRAILADIIVQSGFRALQAHFTAAKSFVSSGCTVESS